MNSPVNGNQSYDDGAWGDPAQIWPLLRFLNEIIISPVETLSLQDIYTTDPTLQIIFYYPGPYQGSIRSVHVLVLSCLGIFLSRFCPD